MYDGGWHKIALLKEKKNCIIIVDEFLFWFQTCFLWSWNVGLIVVAEKLFHFPPWFAFQWNVQRGTIIKKRSFFFQRVFFSVLLAWQLAYFYMGWLFLSLLCTEMSCVDFKAFHVRSWPDYDSNASVDFFFFMWLRRCCMRAKRTRATTSSSG